MRDFEFIEHTADIGIRVYGDTLEDLFRNSACALFSILINREFKKNNNKVKNEKVILESETIEELFVTWLNELLSLFYTYNFLSSNFSILIEEKEGLQKLSSSIKGSDFNPYESKIDTEVKAATYHDLKVIKKGEGYMAEVIFDI